MNITITFFEPIRMMEWIDPSERKRKSKNLRAQSFARWHKCKINKDLGKPFITGTLLRSAVIRAAEHLLVLQEGKSDNIGCCPGKFSTNDPAKDKIIYLRQRTTPVWTDDALCDDNHLCPFCELIGRKVNPEKGIKSYKKKDQNISNIKFDNLHLPQKTEVPEKIAQKRTLNRVDYATGKAHDFFKILEIDHRQFPVFEGKIVIAEYVSPAARSLLIKSLKFIDRLCGSLCKITFDENNDDHITNPKILDTKNAQQTADQLITILEKNAKTQYLRILSDAVRELGRDRKKINELPKDHNGKFEHYIWDLSNGNLSIRSLLQQKADKIYDNDQFAAFFKSLGTWLYHHEKESSGGLKKSQRILGNRAYYGKNQFTDRPPDIQIVPDREFLFYGTLTSETPFFFGLESEETQQTDFTILLDRNNHYRLPRSALRGVLRRDIRIVMDDIGCDVRLGGYQCMCPICQIMRNITIMDVRNEHYTENPEVRQRIRLNPYTGTVAEGALFSMELGPQGMEFPFILRYRGNDTGPPESLIKVLLNWVAGKAFLSGASSTGKGRFKLHHLKQKEFLLKDNTYLDERGWRNRENEIPDLMPLKLFETKTSLWEKKSIEIYVKSPLLNGDPVRALVSGNGMDIVSFKKYTSVGFQQVYAYKSESLKGIFRTALGRKFQHKDSVSDKVLPLLALNHKDCDCPLCRLFGSEYESGKIKFEDLLFSTPPEEKKFDHVAIDRFTGGAVNQKKFDDYSLVGTPKKPLKLEGALWIRKDLSENDRNNLNAAFWDIKKGLYPLGAKAGIGYGQVQDIVLTPPIIKESKADSFYNNQNTKLPDKKITDANISISEEAVYFPHYFLKPHQKVHRKTIPLDHLSLHHNDCCTGKITLTLTTKTPLIVPDTENDDAFHLKSKTMTNDGRYHKSYAFFSINDEIMIPGSEIRGMISSVFEALTNSCFRIFEEKHRLSWRMEADPDILGKFKPGRVIQCEDGLRMVKMEEYRYPFYDNKDLDYSSWEGEEKPVYDHPTPSDKMISTLSEYNRNHRPPDNTKASFKIIKPESSSKASFMYTATPADNEQIHDTNCVLKKKVNGYLKISGPNKVEKEKSDKKGDDQLPNPIQHNRIYSQTIFVQNAQRKKDRTRLIPEFIFLGTNVKYTMNKRCERVFVEPENINHKGIPISQQAKELFKQLVNDYRNNAEQQETPDVFRTILPEKGKIEEGLLVYFREEQDEVVEIIPVKISRKVDDRFIGKRLSKALRPCHGEWLETDDLSGINQYPEKKLFTRHPKGLCPACQLFGTGAYKGKLRFGFATLTNDPVWLNSGDHSQILPLLERPRPTWAVPNATQSSKVPGRKFYIHHHAWKHIQAKNHPSTGQSIDIDINNRTVQPLGCNNTFQFDIHFENLQIHELGLLLYTLQLEEGLSHKLGMGKAFGFGSIDLNMKTLLLLDPKDNQWINKTDQTDIFIDKGKEHLEKLFEKKWNSIDHINDLKSLLCYTENEIISVFYPLLRQKDYPDQDLPGYEELKQNFQQGIQIRQHLLTTPWTPWAYREKKLNTLGDIITEPPSETEIITELPSETENITGPLSKAEVMIEPFSKADKIVYPVSKVEIIKYLQIRSATMEIPHDAQWVFLTGNNAYGKTTLLQAIVTGLYGKIYNDTRDEPFYSECDIRIKIDDRWTNDLKNKLFKSYKNFVAYGPSRLNISSGDARNIKRYHSLFETDKVYYHDIEDELCHFKDRNSQRVDLIKSILEDLMPSIDSIDIKEDKKTQRFYVRYIEKNTPDIFKLSELSSGNKSILAMIGDLIIRFTNDQEGAIKDKKDFKGLVIIDELDLHLHPIWQRKLPELLSEAFPKVRFIVSTHSLIPFLGAPKNSAFFKVNRNHDHYINVERIDIDISNLLPNTILTSPLFDMGENGVTS
ncbi:MAG: TIGR03986 family CRISPR-associated RAMP protein [Candidatus Magnetomorum sp.]|nr:TIGR03986 family CRISPR-associated RAMP protein [Candidatus Magnetomorum sp.]